MHPDISNIQFSHKQNKQIVRKAFLLYRSWHKMKSNMFVTAPALPVLRVSGSPLTSILQLVYTDALLANL